MSEALKDLELIEKALLESMNPEESRRFEEKMQEKHFVEQYHQEKALFLQVQTVGHSRLKSELQEIESSISKSIKPANRSRMIWIGAAASIILLIVFLFPLLQQDSTDQLFRSYYKPLPNLVDPISKGTSTERTPYQLYEMGEYSQALQGLKGIQQNEDQSIYSALCLIELNINNQAIQQLNSIVQNPQHTYSDEARWYLALLYLREKRLEDAKSVLQEIASEKDNFYTEKSSDLLEKLD